ncbi:sensor histidine kinase [Micromonosporaceae bacterium Da 78-11]
MTLLSPGRRMLLIVAFALLAGYCATEITDRLLRWARPLATVPCSAAGGICEPLTDRPVLLELVAVLSTLAVLLLLGFVAVQWAVRPVADLLPAIANIGPQNLGHRLHLGDGRDELSRLGRTIDDMMDRIATGYEAQRRFAADASHELRTPLAVQRTLIEVGMAQNPSPEQLELLTAQLLATNERNERLIEGLLVLSESDRGLLARAPLRLDTIVAAVLDDHRVRAAEAGVTITGRLAPRLVHGEQVLLERLVTNLVQNAVKYNRRGGTIDVQVGGRPALVVENSGDDVPPEAVAGLFEPFRRLAGTRIDHSGGAGLGLSIARSIVRAHDGLISARPRGRDGLRVEIVLPD